ncbi:MAG: membrane protein [Lysobacterales bacterium]|jgi:outer membrane protein OmpA-like peptidoglycan-associated protein|nr:MAG: membrane protein [Xanthomonadales bacterium]
MFRRLARFLALLIGPLPAFASDAPGTADPPGMKRIEGSRILFQSRADHDRLRFALEKLNWIGHEGKLAPFNSASAEGRRLSTYYALPERMMPLEAMRNYEAELRAQGFEILFSGGGEEIQTLGYGNLIARHVLGMTGTYSNPEERAQWPLQNADDRSAAYFAARKTDEKGAETYVSGYFGLYKLGGPWEITRGVVLPAGVAMARIDRLEVKPREQRMVFVSSEEMAEQIALNGRVALYGIEFEFDSAKITPAAEATLAEIAKLLAAKPALRILVVGHTDSQGSFEYNRKLSQQRAEAVVGRLSALGIAKERLFPVGVGFAAPIASNLTEDGRARNRRVELVDLAGGKLP